MRFFASTNARYPIDIQVRSTNDLDLFLSSHVIVDQTKVNGLLKALAKLSYRASPEAHYFQFAKVIELYGQQRSIRIDLLAAPPGDSDRGRVRILEGDMESDGFFRPEGWRPAMPPGEAVKKSK